jgi:hypothetical protein
MIAKQKHEPHQYDTYRGERRRQEKALDEALKNTFPASDPVSIEQPGTPEGNDAMRIKEIDVQDYARQLLEAHGATAVAEAAQKACDFEKDGKKEDAETWRHIEAALKSMRGPHES